MALYDPVPPAPVLSPAEAALQRAEVDPAAAARHLGLEPQQVLNLARLARYLRSLPNDYRKFEMEVFQTPADGLLGVLAAFRDTYHARPVGCGTVACAVGHGVSAGIAARPREHWSTYARRCFTGHRYGLYAAFFNHTWAHVDNTPHGAAARICKALAEPESVGSMTYPLHCRPRTYAQYLA